MYNHGFHPRSGRGLRSDQRSAARSGLQKATKLIVSSQKGNPKGAGATAPSQDADTTVSGAQMVALFAARNAGVRFLRKPSTGAEPTSFPARPSGGFGYTTASGANLPRSAIGSLILYGQGHRFDAYKNSVEYLKKRRSVIPAQVLQPLLYLPGHLPNQRLLWNSEFPELPPPVHPGRRRSWNGSYGDLRTSAALLSLALNYRYLPIYER